MQRHLQALGSANILLVGDSTTYEMYASLWSLLAPWWKHDIEEEVVLRNSTNELYLDGVWPTRMTGNHEDARTNQPITHACVPSPPTPPPICTHAPMRGCAHHMHSTSLRRLLRRTAPESGKLQRAVKFQ